MWNFPPVASRSYFPKFQILEHLGFQIFDFEMFKLGYHPAESKIVVHDTTEMCGKCGSLILYLLYLISPSSPAPSLLALTDLKKSVSFSG